MSLWAGVSGGGGEVSELWGLCAVSEGCVNWGAPVCGGQGGNDDGVGSFYSLLVLGGLLGGWGAGFGSLKP